MGSGRWARARAARQARERGRGNMKSYDPDQSSFELAQAGCRKEARPRPVAANS